MCDVSCTHTKHILIGNNDKNHFYLFYLLFIYLFIFIYFILFFFGGGGGGGRAVYIYGYLTIIRDYTVVMYKHT